MLDIDFLRKKDFKIVTVGSHPGIIQSILDFDYLAGKKEPSLIGIIANGRKFERYFFGKKEVLIPVFATVSDISEHLKKEISLFLNFSSGRRVFSSTMEVLETFPNLLGGSIFAENVPEIHSLKTWAKIKNKDIFIIGPASVGLIIPGFLKMGAAGGVNYRQLINAKLLDQGSVAVLSGSGGMTNEIINTVTGFGGRVSFALSFGGERFPILSPENAFLAAERDPATKIVVYFGELGGTDEYDLSELLKSKKVSKKVVCYIAGSVAEMFDAPPQFGHAKALAESQEETARGKREILKKAGAKVAQTYQEFLDYIKDETEVYDTPKKEYNTHMVELNDRKKALVTSGISGDKNGNPQLLGEDLLEFASKNSFASIASSLFLGKKIKSKELEEFVDFVLRLLVDHGPYVSGAVNTIVTARAGRDLVSSLAAGLLTIGPRFGGAINEAAGNWLLGVKSGKSVVDFVEGFASRKVYISGIGHKKYRSDFPDPRVAELLKFADKLSEKRFTKFALDVEKTTTAKKGNLILNVDGAIAAVMLDILSDKEKMSDEELQKLADIEFFNSIFVLSRSVGFISHFLDQKRLDEGIFRLPEDMVLETDVLRKK